MEMAWLLVSQRSQQCQVCQEDSTHGCRRYGSIKYFFKALATGTQRVSLTGPSLLLGTVGTQRTALACPSLLHNCQGQHEGRKGLQWWFHPQRMTQQQHPSSIATWFLSKGILCFRFPSFFPSGHLPAVNSSPHPRITLQSPCSSSQPCAHQWTCVPVWSTYGHDTHCLCVSHSIQTVTDHLLHLPLIASNASLLFQPISLDLESRTPTRIQSVFCEN